MYNSDILGPIHEMLIAMPSLFLQTAALIGLFSISLGVGRGVGRLAHKIQFLPGAMFGVAGVCLIILLTNAAVPFPYSALVFLAGSLGGWQSSIVSFLLIGLAEVVDVGELASSAQFLDVARVLVDTVPMAVGGALVHWLRKKKAVKITSVDMFTQWACYTGVSFLCLPILQWLGEIPQVASLSAAGQRVALFPITMMLIAGTLELFRRHIVDRDAHIARFKQTEIDPLTYLPNRRALLRHVNRLLAEASPAVHTLILIEAQNLQNLALVHGHDWIDEFWAKLATGVHEQVKFSGFHHFKARCFMFSDMTLAVVLHNVSKSEIRESNLVVGVRQSLERSLECSTSGPTPNLRFGIIDTNSGQWIDAAAILRDLSLTLRADELEVRYFDPSLIEKAARIEAIRKLVVRWVATCSPPLRYQTKHDLRTGEVVGAEALLRAVDEGGHPISARDVLEVVERFELEADFEWCTIETVIRDIAHASRNGSDLSLSVNVSSASLAVPGFGERVARLIASASIPPGALTIEITEFSRVPDTIAVVQNWKDLTSNGIRLSLDDFGTGYSALALLAKYPFDEVKLDYSFVARLEEPRMRAAISLACDSARKYGAEFVAEGIETEAQLSDLLTMGVRYGQGFLFSTAQPIEHLYRSAQGQQIQQITRGCAQISAVQSKG